MGKLKETLNDLERNDIIAKVKEAVEWVSNLVIVEKTHYSEIVSRSARSS